MNTMNISLQKKKSFDFLCLHNNENTEKDGETKTECQETCYSGRINNQANSPNPKPVPLSVTILNSFTFTFT